MFPIDLQTRGRILWGGKAVDQMSVEIFENIGTFAIFSSDATLALFLDYFAFNDN